MFHVSHVMGHVSVSGVMCHMSGVKCNIFFLKEILELVGGESVLNGAYPF